MSEHLKYIQNGTTQFFATYVLANYCMPTLLKVKPSNLINVNKIFITNEIDFFKDIANELEQFDSCYSILYEDDVMFIILIYNREHLFHTIILAENERFLKSFGYEFYGNIINSTIERLKQRYKNYKNRTMDFPHEIGVMLGYPLRDVEAFINNKGRNYILSGCWKVYHDVDNASKTFDDYRRIRENAIKVIDEGKTLRDILE
ncbi:MAG: hypothetical protein K0S01_1232 [Herbinix sp.]|nr:hypothetical protein [Herbinix sp.]